MAYMDEYQGFVPLVGRSVPSRNYGFTPLVGGKSFLPSIESRSGSGSWGDLGDTGFVTPPEEQPQYDFFPFTGKSKEEEVKDDSSDLEPLQPQVPLPVKPPQSQVSPSDDPMSEDEDTLGTSQTSTISDQETITDFLENIDNTINEALGLTPPMQPAPDVVGLEVGKGLDAITTPQGIATGAAKGLGLGFVQGALGINAPLGLAVGVITGIADTLSHQSALQNVVDLEAEMMGKEARSIGFFDALGSYFFGVDQLTDEEHFTSHILAEEYFAPQGVVPGTAPPQWGQQEKGRGLFGVPELVGEMTELEAFMAANQTTIEEFAEEEEDNLDPGAFGSFLGKGITTVEQAIEQAFQDYSDTAIDTDPFGQTAVSQAPAHGAEGELGDAPFDPDTTVDPNEFTGITGTPPTQTSTPPSTTSDDGDDDDSGEGSADEGDPSSGDCWVAGTQILMEDGSCRNIENLKIGDKVMSFPENTELRRWNTPLEVKPIISLVVGTVNVWHLNDSMVSGAEWMIKGDGTAAIVKWLNVGDTVMDKDGNLIEVHKVEPAQGELKRQVIYNFETEDNYSYIANGMRTIRGRAVPSKGYTKRLSGGDTNIYQGSMQDEYKRKFGN